MAVDDMALVIEALAASEADLLARVAALERERDTWQLLACAALDRIALLTRGIERDDLTAIRRLLRQERDHRLNLTKDIACERQQVAA